MSDAPADYETRRRLCNTIDEAVAEWQRSLSPRPLPEYLANVLGDAGVQVAAVVRPTRDQIAAVIAEAHTGYVQLAAGRALSSKNARKAADALIARGWLAVSDSQETPPL